MITPWKNTGQKNMRKIKLFRISFDIETGEWVRNSKGKYWGYITKNRRIVKYTSPKADINVGVTMDKPSLGIINSEKT